MSRIQCTTALALGCLLSLVLACNKGPAREALAESEQAIAAARPELEQFAPEELAALQARLTEAHAHLDGGRSTDALSIAQVLPGELRDALSKAERRRGEVVDEWKRLAGRVPLILDGADVRARELAAAKALPRTLPPETFAAAQAELAGTRHAWTEAKGVFENGQVARAVSAGREVQARAETVASQLGLTPAAAMAAASTGTSAPPAAIPKTPATAQTPAQAPPATSQP